jgi:hypothetical protein
MAMKSTLGFSGKSLDWQEINMAASTKIKPGGMIFAGFVIM